jgi:hypothetical protein
MELRCIMSRNLLSHNKYEVVSITFNLSIVLFSLTLNDQHCPALLLHGRHQPHLISSSNRIHLSSISLGIFEEQYIYISVN